MSIVHGVPLMDDYVVTATNQDTGEVVALQFLAPEEYPRMAEVLKAFAERCTGACEEARRHFTLGKIYARLEPLQDHVYVMELWPAQTFNAVYKGKPIAEILEKTIEIAGLARVLLEMDYVHLDIYGDTILVKDDGSLLLASIEEIFPLNREEQVNRMLELISQLPYATDVLLTDLPHLRLVDDEQADVRLNSQLQAIVQKARSGDYLKAASGEGLKQRALSAVDHLMADLNAFRETIAVSAGPAH